MAGSAGRLNDTDGLSAIAVHPARSGWTSPLRYVLRAFIIRHSIIRFIIRPFIVCFTFSGPSLSASLFPALHCPLHFFRPLIVRPYCQALHCRHFIVRPFIVRPTPRPQRIPKAKRRIKAPRGSRLPSSRSGFHRDNPSRHSESPVARGPATSPAARAPRGASRPACLPVLQSAVFVVCLSCSSGCASLLPIVRVLSVLSCLPCLFLLS